MKSKSPDCSRSASNSPRISGRDPSTHEMHSANAMPAQSFCHTALTVAPKSLPQGDSMVSIGHLIGRKKPLICQKWRQVKAGRAIWQTLPFEKEGQWAWTKLVIRTVV